MAMAIDTSVSFSTQGARHTGIILLVDHTDDSYQIQYVDSSGDEQVTWKDFEEVTYLGAGQPKSDTSKGDNKWEFNVQAIVDIDYELISNDLSREFPVILMNVIGKAKNRVVMIHSSVMKKAQVLGIAAPFKIAEDEIFLTAQYHAAIWLNDNHFSSIVNWVRMVRATPWGVEKEASKIIVTKVRV